MERQYKKIEYYSNKEQLDLAYIIIREMNHKKTPKNNTIQDDNGKA